jgi:LacI family transcriptional regulator, galactose operon repressor
MATLTRSNTLPDQVRGQIVEELYTGSYEIGDRLPTLDAWGKRFNVSRRTVQLAIDQLRGEGMLQSHVGRGAYLVRKPGGPDLLNRTSAVGDTQRSRTGPGDQPGASARSAHSAHTFAVLDGLAEVSLNNEVGESWTTRILHGIRLEASEQNIDLLLINDNIDLSTPESICQHLREISGRFDGLITFPLMPYEQMAYILDEKSAPIITINRLSAGTQYNYVAADYFGGSRLVGQMFAEAGLTDVWFLSTPVSNVYSKEQRYAGLCDGMHTSGIPSKPRVIIAPSAEEQAGYQSVKSQLSDSQKPGAIYCSGDYLAIGAIRALQESGLSVGGDRGVAVVGSSGLSYSRFTSPSLSVVRIPMEEMGRRAVQKLLEMTSNGSTRSPGQSLPTELILRGSTPDKIRDSGWLEKQTPPRPGIDL